MKKDPLRYSRQSEKLSVARYCLMLPHTSGIDASISEALDECYHAFYRMDESGLDDNARRWVEKIKTFREAAETRSLTADEQRELSDAVDELAHWFEGYGRYD